VFHTAAVLDDGVLGSLAPAQVERVLAVKAGAAWRLHEATAQLELDAFVLFSSIAGTFGASGQGNYAPGNAYLDAFARYRRSLGLPAVSIAWGPWADGGMALGGVGEIARRHGVPEMDPVLALRALRSVLGQGAVCPVIADVRWDRFFVAYTASRPSPFLSDLPECKALAAAESPVAPEVGLPARLSGLTGEDREAAVVELVCAQIAAVLGHGSGAAVEPKRAFKELGFDSVTAVELRNGLARAAGLPLPATLVFDYPTPVALARYLLSQLGGETGPMAATDAFAELDRLEAALSALSVSDVERVGITARLDEVVRRWTGAARAREDVETEVEIESATDDEIFDLIGEEFGIS
jgi:acyl carrier protein